MPKELGRRVDRNQIKLWQRSMHEPIPLETRRHTERADRLVDDDAQVVLLPLHVVYGLILGHRSFSPFRRGRTAPRRGARTSGGSRSTLPNAHVARDALRREGFGTGWTAGRSQACTALACTGLTGARPNQAVVKPEQQEGG